VNTLLWLVNLFSLFSSFGALVVVAFIAVRSRRPAVWKLFAIVLMFVTSYAGGMLRFLLTTGFTMPRGSPMDLLGGSRPLGFLLSALPYLALAWLIPSATNEFLHIRSRVFYLVEAPVVAFTFVLPLVLIILGENHLTQMLNVVVLGPILLQAVLIEYPIIMIARRRDSVPGRIGSVVRIATIVMGVVVVPLMIMEDLFVIFRDAPVYNIAEAIGFFFLCTVTIVLGVDFIAASFRRNIEPASLLDVAEAYGLTERETDVLQELVAGASYKEIALHLSISLDTVKTHVSRVYRKVGVSAKQELKYKIRDFTS
jgi:DNA-binding CsgD family transcriptional regulator